jgi:hypothetical protein
VCGALGACVECNASSDCAGELPICEGNTCVACSSTQQCEDKNPSFPVCIGETGQCMECDDYEDCGLLGDPDRPLCGDNNTCVPCAEAAIPTMCSFFFSGSANFNPAGCDPDTGRCVECLAGSTCEIRVTVGASTPLVQGTCATDDVTCEPVTCEDDTDSNTSVFYCSSGYCRQQA